MPFKSKAQQRWMHTNKPKMAKKWEAETVTKLPERVKKKKPLQKYLEKYQK